jgi:hypothetical protein
LREGAWSVVEPIAELAQNAFQRLVHESIDFVKKEYEGSGALASPVSKELRNLRAFGDVATRGALKFSGQSIFLRLFLWLAVSPFQL